MPTEVRVSRVVSVCLVLITLFIGGVALKNARPVLFPFFLAVFLSFILYPVEDFLTRFRFPRWVSIVLILLMTFLILYLLGAVVYSAGKSFAAEFPHYGSKIKSILIQAQDRLDLPFNPETVDWASQLDLSRVGGFLISSLGPFFSFMSNLFLVLIFLIFILAGRGRTRAKLESSLNRKRAKQVGEVIRNIDVQIQRYLAIKTVVSFFTGIFVTTILILFGVDFAVFFGFLTFILNFIPNIGSIFATAFPVIIALFQFESAWPAFWILIFLMAIQQIMGNLIEPRLMGRGLGLSPLVVLFFLFFWGWLWGIPGMILAVPIAAIVKIVCDNIPELRLVAVLMSKD